MSSTLAAHHYQIIQMHYSLSRQAAPYCQPHAPHSPAAPEPAQHALWAPNCRSNDCPCKQHGAAMPEVAHHFHPFVSQRQRPAPVPHSSRHFRALVRRSCHQRGSAFCQFNQLIAHEGEPDAHDPWTIPRGWLQIGGAWHAPCRAQYSRPELRTA